MNTHCFAEYASTVLDNGYHPIPCIGKRPIISEWPRWCAEQPSPADIDLWSGQFPNAKIGFACGSIIAIDVDVMDPADAKIFREMVFEHFGYSPLLRIGNAPKFAVLYRAEGSIRSLNRKFSDGSGDGIDIISDGKQIIAFGMHEGAGRPYQWPDKSPLEVPASELPAITEAQIDGFTAKVNAHRPLGGGGGGGGGGRGGGGGGSPDIIRDKKTGLVIDGREGWFRKARTDAWNAANRKNLPTPEEVAKSSSPTRFRVSALKRSISEILAVATARSIPSASFLATTPHTKSPPMELLNADSSFARFFLSSLSYRPWDGLAFVLNSNSTVSCAPSFTSSSTAASPPARSRSNKSRIASTLSVYCG